MVNHFSLMFHIYTPWKRKEISAFLTFSGGIEMEYWLKMERKRPHELLQNTGKYWSKHWATT